MTAQTAIAARRLLRHSTGGVLSTLSAEMEGHPVGSVVPIVLDGRGRPVVHISRLAQHTQNLAADPRACITLADRSQDVDVAARLMWISTAEPLPEDEVPSAVRRFRFRFPGSQERLSLPDFHFMRLIPKKARYVGGLGQATWINSERLLRKNPFYSDEAGVAARLIGDNGPFLRRYFPTTAKPLKAIPEVVSIEADGIELRLGENLLTVDFQGDVVAFEQLEAELRRGAVTALRD